MITCDCCGDVFEPASRNAKYCSKPYCRGESKRRYVRRTHLQKTFGITREEFEELLARQGGGCYACGTTSGAKELHVDHDHSCCGPRSGCKKCIRGILCGPCNRALAYMKDSPDIARRLAEHLSNRPYIDFLEHDSE